MSFFLGLLPRYGGDIMFSFQVSIQNNLKETLLPHFTYTMNMGDKIGLIGEEGNGKSLLLKAIVNHPSLQVLSTEVKIHPANTVCGYLEQQLQDTHQSVFDYACGEYESYALFAKQFMIMFPYLNNDDIHRPLHTFSGGECIKIQILKIEWLNPDIILLDEPTNNLDIESINWLKTWITGQRRPLLFVSHDIKFLEEVSNRIIHLEKPHDKADVMIHTYEGGYSSYKSYHTNKILNHNTKVKEEIRAKRIQEEKWQKMYQQVQHRQSTQTRQDPHKGKMLKKKMHSLMSQKRQIDKNTPNNKYEGENEINIYFDSKGKVVHRKIWSMDIPSLEIDRRVLSQNISLNIYSKDTIVCMGANGVGKTTLLKEMIQNIPSTLNVGIMHQEYGQDLDLNKSAVENLWINGEKESLTKIRTYLGSLHFKPEEMNLPLNKLSGGQLTLLYFLKLVLKNPDILLLDEPTRNLSPLSIPTIYKLLDEFEGAIFCITHDQALIEYLSPKIYELDSSGLHYIEL